MKHTATPKTWDVRKQGACCKSPETMSEQSKARLCKTLSEATGWSESWLMGKDNGLLLGMARKHL